MLPLTKSCLKSLNNSMKNFNFVFLILFLALVLSCSAKSTTKPVEAFDAEKAFAKANELLEEKKYEEARSALSEIQSRDITKNYAPLAHLRLADSYASEDEFDRAIEEYKKFLEIYPEHRYASYAQYQIASIYFNQIEGPERGYGAAKKAIEEFEKLKKLFPRNPYKDAVEVRIEMSKNIIADHEFMVGEFYYKKDSYNAALNRLKRLLEQFPGYKKEADVLFHIAMSHKKLGEKDKAKEYFSLLIQKYPNSNITPQAKKELSEIKN